MNAIVKQTIKAKDILPVDTLLSEGADPEQVLWFEGKVYAVEHPGSLYSLVKCEMINGVDSFYLENTQFEQVNNE